MVAIKIYYDDENKKKNTKTALYFNWRSHVLIRLLLNLYSMISMNRFITMF